MASELLRVFALFAGVVGLAWLLACAYRPSWPVFIMGVAGMLACLTLVALARIVG